MEKSDYQTVEFKLPSNQAFTHEQILNGSVRVDVTMPSGNIRTVDAPLKKLIDWKDLIDWNSACPLFMDFDKSCCHKLVSILKKYKCNHCEKSFTQSRNRRRHVKLNHNP